MFSVRASVNTFPGGATLRVTAGVITFALPHEIFYTSLAHELLKSFVLKSLVVVYI